jgi:hypothetical protein
MEDGLRRGVNALGLNQISLFSGFVFYRIPRELKRCLERTEHPGHSRSALIFSTMDSITAA